MSYTNQEIQAAVEKLVRTSIRRTQGTLGNRQVGVTFNDYQDAAAGMFILFYNAPYYLIYLAARNLKEALVLQQTATGELIDVVEACGRKVTPITNLSPLANARVALDGMLLASASRTKTFTDIEDVPAYQRFSQNTQQFLDESSKNIRQDGEVVRTPGEARALLASYYDTLADSYADVLRRVGLLATAIDDFSALDLPITLIRSILENARDSIQDWYIQLQEMNERERLSILRAVTLDILAARSTVSGFSSLSGPTTFVPLEGVGGVYADSTHPALPAELNSTELGPYVILQEAPFLYFELDDGNTTTIELQGSFVAALEGTVYGPYLIGHPNSLDANGVNNNWLRINVLNYTSWGSVDQVDVEFPEVGASWEAWEVAGFVNYYTPTPLPLVCEPYCNPLKFGGGCNITWNAGDGWFEIESINPSTDFSALGIVEGAYILVPPQDPSSVNQNAIYRVRAGGVGTPTLSCDLVMHPGGLSGPALDELAIDVRITDDQLPIRLRLTGANDKAARLNPSTLAWTHVAKTDEREDALLNKWGIALPKTSVDTGARVVGDVDLTTLSLPADVAGRVVLYEVDTSGVQVVDLTGFLGATPAALVAEITFQMVAGSCDVADGNFIRFKSPTTGGDSYVNISGGDLLDKVFTGGAAGAPYEGSGSGAKDLQFNGCTYLGFYPPSEVLCRRTTAAVVATNVTNSPQAAISNEARVEAETYFSATHYSGRGRTDPYNFLRIVASLFEHQSSVATLQAGTTYRFSSTGHLEAGVLGGGAHILVVRASADPNDISLWGTILSVTDTYIEALMGSTLAAPGDVDFEVGPHLGVGTELPHDATVVISGSPENDGAYGVLDSGPTPLDLDLDRPIPFPSRSATLPVYSDIEVGFYGVTFRSLDTTLSTSVGVVDGGADSVHARFFSSVPAGMVGLTSYFQLPEWNRQLNEGDVLELYASQFDSPTHAIAIASLEQSSLILKLSSPLATDLSTYSFDVDITVPFARIRNSRMNNYATLESALESWLGLAINQEAFFKELRRLLNPLYVNQNPTAAQIGSARAQLLSLLTNVENLSVILDAYTADVVPQVDTLLAMLQEKGADRARGILLEAQFSTFFSLNMDETSYSGTVQARLKEISREDLPIRKDNRTGTFAGKGELLGAYDEPDYEFDTSDLDPAGELDIPTGTVF